MKSQSRVTSWSVLAATILATFVWLDFRVMDALFERVADPHRGWNLILWPLLAFLIVRSTLVLVGIGVLLALPAWLAHRRLGNSFGMVAWVGIVAWVAIVGWEWALEWPRLSPLIDWLEGVDWPV